MNLRERRKRILCLAAAGLVVWTVGLWAALAATLFVLLQRITTRPLAALGTWALLALAQLPTAEVTILLIFLWCLACTHGAFPGDVIPPYHVAPCGLRPLLPAAATTTIPAATAAFAASVSGSRLYDSYTPVAIDKLATRMFNSVRWSTT